MRHYFNRRPRVYKRVGINKSSVAVSGESSGSHHVQTL